MRPVAILGAALLVAPLPLAAQDLDLSHGGPIDITASDGLEWRQHEQQVIARGNAKAIRDNVTVTADRLIAWYRKKPAAATSSGEAGKPAGAAPDQTRAAGPAAGETAQGDVKEGTKTSQANAAGPPASGGSAATGQTGAPANAQQPGSAGAQPGDKTAQAGSGGQGLLGDSDSGGNEIYRVQAEGNVHVYTQTDQAQGDKATYDLDQAVMVMTGRNLKLTTPSQVLTARDDMEYWAQKHMAVARGDAVVVTNDGRRLSADTVVAYTVPTNSQPTAGPKPKPAANAPGTVTPGLPAAQSPAPPAGTETGAAAGKAAAKPSGSAPAADDPLGASGKLEKVEAYGNVVIRTVTDTVTGDRAVYVPDSGIARVAGKVRITRGQNQLAGAEAEVNLKTGISRLLPSKGSRVSGLVVPNDQTNAAISTPPGQPPAAPKGPMTPPTASPNPMSIAPSAGKPK
jgi:lipopolysaccharide export system protein LptA